MTGANVTCLLTHKQSDCHEINVKVVEISVPTKATANLIGSVPSPEFTSTEKDHRTPASTNKHAYVDDIDGSETSYTEDESDTNGDTSNDPNGVLKVPQCDGQAEKSAREAPTNGEEVQGAGGAPNDYAYSMTSRWTISGSKLYSIQPIQSKDLFEDQGDQERFEYKVRRSNHTRFATTCRKRDCERVITAGKLKYGTYWHVKSSVKEYTCGDSGNYNVDFKRTVTKFETDSQNRFTYGFIALGASIEGFHVVIRPVIAIDATHLKAKTRGVLLDAVCKDGNEMIYPLTFGFVNSECTELWTWFLKRLREVILYPQRVLIVSNRHASIFIGMEVSFSDAAYGLGLYGTDEKLRVVGSWAGIGHGEDPRTGVLVYKVFVGEIITVDGLTFESVSSSQVSSIEYAPRYHMVEDCSFVVEWFPVLPGSLLAGAESSKVFCCYRGSIYEKLHHKSTFRIAADVKVKEGLS
ncbi:hypothetical protein Dsin_030495 [Dipteronia sinensis]|uniref:MULE transposase domain-containing protein n=1 Tax=Dipteronia sinensis TaxID=43782 RepID=A0AAD9ZL79_9ROSI|nr:hypothetical protein Dsin_030495 [Dipteronia sinensis]